jgi:hypothetical protein
MLSGIEEVYYGEKDSLNVTIISLIFFFFFFFVLTLRFQGKGALIIRSFAMNAIWHFTSLSFCGMDLLVLKTVTI